MSYLRGSRGDRQKHFNLTMTHNHRITFRNEKQKYNYGRCPSCRMYTVIQKGQTDAYNNRVYKCLKCNKLSASPTNWSHCSLKGVISKDLWNNDCFSCPKYEKGKNCPEWQGKVEDKTELRGTIKKIIGGKK